jgi:four helix bundle protein
MQFSHEDLLAYKKALEYFGDNERLIVTLGTQHAFVDHLSRAGESILFNLVEAVRIRQGKKKMLSLDYAVGSTFECSACLDIAVLKGLLEQTPAVERKKLLLEICKMLIGLRKSWGIPHVAEDEAPYSTGNEELSSCRVFHHERLDMYIVALDFYRWFLRTEPGKHLGSAFEKSVDTLATRVLLNIAEGNGRYSELSRESFLDTANAAAAKLAASLDMGVRRGLWNMREVDDGKGLLVRVGQMTAKKCYAV